MATNSSTGERFVQLTSSPTGSAGTLIKTFGVTNRSVLTDPVIHVSRHYHKIKCDSTGQYVVAMVNNGFIYHSSDYGVTWAQSNAGQANWQGMTMSSDGSIVYASNYGSSVIWKSVDYGATWTSAYNFGSAKKWDSMCCSADGTHVYAGEEPGNLYRSTDSGVTFSVVSGGIGLGYWHEIACDPTGQYCTLLQKHTTGVGIWGSTDYAVNFTQFATPNNALWWGVAQKSNALRTVVGSLTPIYLYT